MFSGLRGQEIILILIVLLVLFGGSQLPKIAKNLGLAQKEFKKGFDDSDESEDEDKKKDTSS